MKWGVWRFLCVPEGWLDLDPRVGKGVNPAVFLLSTTTFAHFVFSWATWGGLPGIFPLQTSTTTLNILINLNQTLNSLLNTNKYTETWQQKSLCGYLNKDSDSFGNLDKNKPARLALGGWRSVGGRPDVVQTHPLWNRLSSGNTSNLQTRLGCRIFDFECWRE